MSSETRPAYQLFMIALCVFALGVLVMQAIFRADPEIVTVLDYADDFICVIFLADFAITFFRAPRRWEYFRTWGWMDLISSIPTLEFVRWGRIARIARITRVLRALRASRELTQLLFRQRGQSAALAAALLALFLIVGSSAAILHFEDLPDSNIKTAEDAIWWAFATITTVGYGDRFPASTEGRLIAAVLMTAGVGLFSAFSGALAAWFLAPEEAETDRELAAIRGELGALRALLERNFGDNLAQTRQGGIHAMTAPSELVECGNCKRWFAAAALDEVFYHATCACRREEAARSPASLSDAEPR